MRSAGAILIDDLPTFDFLAQEWREYAACKDMDTDLFFNEERFEEVFEVCKTCCVRIECLDDSVAYGCAGVRGGYSEDEQSKIVEFRKTTSKRLNFDLTWVYGESQMRVL